MTCVGSACVDQCAAPRTMCAGRCVDLMTAGRHCGACNNACASRPNAPGECLGGACRTRCKSGYADCNGDPTDGCEVDTRSDARHCGGCAQACDAGVCVAGRCAP